MSNSNNSMKCYNSISCIISVLIIVFVLGSIIVDLCFTKPAMRKDIEDIKIEVQSINNKLDGNYVNKATIENDTVAVFNDKK